MKEITKDNVARGFLGIFAFVFGFSIGMQPLPHILGYVFVGLIFWGLFWAALRAGERDL